ncbi:MAG TPA: DUF4271 domain-containing protein [Bacteroidia bacterium]|nr:DUF4271 domain-containing protein [Bacteroidia bacterium]
MTQQSTNLQQEAKLPVFVDKPDSLNSSVSANQDTFLLSAQDSSFKIKVDKGFAFTDNDSLSPIDNFSGAADAPALFKGHQLQPTVTNPIPLNRSIPDWFTIALFITIGFFTWLKLINGKIIQQLFAAFFNNSVTNQIVRDENVLVQKASVMLSLVFYFTTALLLYQVSVYFNWEYKIIGRGPVRFIIFVLFIASAYSFKMVFLKLISTIFRMDRPVSTYIFNIFLINNIIGILLIPLVLLIAFFPMGVDFFIWTGIVILVASFLYRLFRGIIIWTSLARFSLYYLILYLCALEIAPLLIIFKLA